MMVRALAAFIALGIAIRWLSRGSRASIEPWYEPDNDVWDWPDEADPGLYVLRRDQ